MSKSKGNFFTVRDIGKKFPYDVLRFFMLSGAHYRMPLNFSEELMEAAKNSLERIKVSVERLTDLEKNTSKRELAEEDQLLMDKFKVLNKKFDDAMEDDFNTADAIAAIFEMVKIANVEIQADSNEAVVTQVKQMICTLMHIMGVSVEPKEEVLEADIEALIAQRQQARKDKDFAKADAIRDELLENGIVLKDTREGVKWSRA